MATKKQRKRMEKGRRHEYETVWVDEDGNELEEPPEDLPARQPRASREQKPAQKRSQVQQRSTRVPPEPSWQRSLRRSAILGAVFLVVFSVLQGILVGLILAVVYTSLFIPFSYYLDRFAYRRWEKSQPATKKR
jgi:hypothetical protein